jgi:glycosyltransferase involved in cell wall biosynthesis
MKQIDILVPCYNEEAVLPQFYQRTCAVIDALPDYAFTFIFVNDGSRDQTLPILRQLHEKDKRVAYVSLSRNFGKEAAMLAGMDYAEGDALVIMDADLQDPPELLPDMIAWWEKGYRDVSARRRRREGETVEPCLLPPAQEIVPRPGPGRRRRLPPARQALRQGPAQPARMSALYQGPVQLDWLREERNPL